MDELEKANLTYPYPDDEIDLKQLFGALWAGKKLIILITSVFALCSVLYAISLTNYFKSEAIFSLAGDSEQSLPPGYGGLASLAGIRLPTSGENKGALVLATIESREFLKHLITFENILPALMAAKTFDAKNKTLIFDERKYNTKSHLWIRENEPPYKTTPTVLETHRKYLEILSVGQNTSTGFITISVEHVSPIFAKEFSDLIIHEVNALLRQRDLQESTNALEYLTSEISKTSLIEMKNSINQLIQSQLEIQMMAKIREDYVLKTIEPPYVPEKKSKPNRASISILGTMLGGMLGILLVLIRHYFLGAGKQEQSL